MNTNVRDTDPWISLRRHLKEWDIDLEVTAFGAAFDLRIKNTVFPVAIIPLKGFLICHVLIATEVEEEFAARSLPLLNAINGSIPIGSFQIDAVGDLEFKLHLTYLKNKLSKDEFHSMLSWFQFVAEKYNTLIEAVQADLISIEDAVKKVEIRIDTESQASEDVAD